MRRWTWRWQHLGLTLALLFSIWFGSQMPILKYWIEGSELRQNETLVIITWFMVRFSCYVAFPAFFLNLAWNYAHPNSAHKNG